MNKFNSESPHDNFDLCYGKDGTGDITKSENILDFSSVIDLATNQRGLALVTADGVILFYLILGIFCQRK